MTHDRRLLDLHKAGVLTRRQWYILELRYSHRLTLNQIALALDISRGTVTSTIKRAQQKIDLHQREAA